MPRLFAHTQLLVELTPIQARHFVIAEDQIRWIIHNFQQRISAVRGRAHFADRIEMLHQQLEDQRVVVHDKDFYVFHRRFFAGFERAFTLALERARRYSPLLPPVFSSKYKSVISMPFSRALHMS